MKRLILVVLLLLVMISSSKATHIVGGEFEMIHRGISVNGNHMFNINLIMYTDLLHIPPNVDPTLGVFDFTVTISIFRKSDNFRMETLTLILQDPQTLNLVKYYNQDCAASSSALVKTRRLFYTGNQISLSPNRYNDPAGYYISWERCCRNYAITNVFSNDPGTGLIYAGQTFYLEFPPVVVNGSTPFINSSPGLFAPIADYACPNRPYFVDFGGTDADGDSLVYTMVNPLNTLSADAVPVAGVPGPGPYPFVTYRPGFSLSNIMQGDPDLSISSDGLLTVLPKFQGVYVFSVRCAEFRNGVQIGFVIRDFQLAVLDRCPTKQKPVAEAKPINAPDTDFKKDKLELSFTSSTTDESRCVVIRVTDPDSQNPENQNKEKIKIDAIPLGFKDPSVRGDILPDIKEVTITNGGAAEFTACFPQCPYILGPYKIGLIVSDGSCPLPLQDTIVVTVNVQLPPNNLPQFIPDKIVRTYREGSGIVSIPFKGVDTDNDNLVLSLLPSQGFLIDDYGFTFQQTTNQPGLIEAQLTWDTRCDVIDFSQRTNFPIVFTLNDLDVCDLLPPDTLTVDLTMDLYDFHKPVITYEPQPGLKDVTITKKIFETLNFNVLGSDGDNDRLVLSGQGKDFTLASMGASFPGDTGDGNVSSPFAWSLDCDKFNLNIKDEYDFQFILVDSENRCNYFLADTLNVRVKIDPADNIAPIISADGLTSQLRRDLTLGQPLVIDLLGTDPDTSPRDILKIELISAEGSVPPEGFVFETEEGTSPVMGKLSWNPGCEIYKNNIFENAYQFAFRVLDNRCFNIKGDTVTVDVNIKDVESTGTDFLPPNIITPNDDGCNDFFALEGFDDLPLSGSGCTTFSLPNLPPDNCLGRFLNIRVYNRWGHQVYESDNRKFRWYAPDQAAGVYYYYIAYSHKEYKGVISVQY